MVTQLLEPELKLTLRVTSGILGHKHTSQIDISKPKLIKFIYNCFCVILF